MDPIAAELLAEIEQFLDRHALAPSTFGQMCTGNRHLVRDLRKGRGLRTTTVAVIREFMAEYEPPDRPNEAVGMAAA